MKLLLAGITALGILLGGLLGMDSKPKPTVTSIRAFEEPLVAVGGDASANKDAALIAALQTFQHRKTYEDVSAITNYLDGHPQSAWKFSLLANLGIVYRKTGHFSKALDAWEQAWSLGKSQKNIQIEALANRTLAELSSLLSSLGRTERLGPLLAELKGRTIYGSASAQLMYSSENLLAMKTKPGESFKCGPYALGSIRAFTNLHGPEDGLLMKAQSSTKGFSLTQVRDLSTTLKMNYQMAKRQAGASFIVPAVAHWKTGHYAAILKKVGDNFITQDPTFAQQLLVTPQALEEESSGYYLVPSGPLPTGWQPVSDSEGDTVWGRGKPPGTVPNATTPGDCELPCSSCGTGSGSSAGGTGGSGGPSGSPAAGGSSGSSGSAGNSTGAGGAGGGGSTAVGPRMAVYHIFTMLDSLSVSDIPVGYTPPVGPDVQATVTYNELEYGQPSTFTYFNFGPSWNCSWSSFVVVPTSVGATATLYTRGGGQEIYSPTGTSTTDSRGYTNYYASQIQSQATLWVNGTTYERRLPDGSKEVFGQPDAPTSPVRVFLTSIVDSRNQSLTLGYDTTSSYYLSTGYLRLTTVTDALGLVTTLSYGFSSDPLKVTQIADPYGRSATFSYSSSAPYQLASITDVIGITSSFTYSSGSAMSVLTTPYGSTNFSFSWDGNYTSVGSRSLLVTEPDSSQIKVESEEGYDYPYPSGTLVTSGSAGATTEPFPTWNDTGTSGHYGITSWAPEYIQYRNTYYWDKKAMHDAAGDYTKAHIYHWLHTPDGSAVAPVLESEKPALENRIWYTYPGQTGGSYGSAAASILEGTSARPSAVVCVITDASHPMVWQYQYNNSLNPAALTAMIDPIGRQTNYTYDTTAGIDLTGVTQNNGSGTDTLASLSYGSNPHGCPTSVTDAAGETTSYTYNGQGQVLTVTPPTRSGHSAETTTYGYTGNYLTSITGPLSGATKTMTYDTLGGHTVNRVKTVADAESYTLTLSYDNLDRVTQIAYPDSTTETFSYLNPTTSAVDLDLHSSTDRLGRTTTRTYDSTRHMLTMTDPLSRTTTYTWCSCGSMSSLTDPKGNVTYFNRDVESRLTSKVYAGGTQPPTTPDYTYDTIGRMATFTDKRGDVDTYSYNLDNTLSGIAYSLASGTAATPNITYAYDSYYKRVTSVGGVSLTYYPSGSLGAEQPHVVTNTMTGGTAAITYTYDEWGRAVGRNIDSANSQTVTLDSLGRVTNVLNLLAPTTPGFAYTYFDPTHPTNRVGGITYPNGQSVAYNYLGNTGDERLSEIKNLTPTSAVLSQNDYTYDAMGKILTWQQQTDSNIPLLWTYGYDAADQLTSAVQTNTAITSPAIISDSYGYDLAGNVNSSNASGVTRSPTSNALNQLTGSTPSGNQTVRFSGTMNGTDTVTVGGSSATTSGTNFIGGVTLVPGSTNTVSVVATDASSNVRTNHYQAIVATQPTYTPTYDADGNELTNGAGQTYTWDAKNELASIVYTSGSYSGSHTEFTYDALGRRTAIVEKSGTTVGSGTVNTTRQMVWDSAQIAEERNASNTVTKRFFALGEQLSGTSYYYTRDHLGSVREMTDSSGTIQARYDYDPHGRETQIQGALASDFQYGGYYEHATSGLNLTLFRAYDPIPAKWLSRDPLPNAERRLGPNLYEYVMNDPLRFNDPLGLACDPETTLGYTFIGIGVGGILGAQGGGWGILGGAILGGGAGYVYGSGDLSSWTGDPDLQPIPIPDLMEELGKEAYDIGLDLGFK